MAAMQFWGVEVNGKESGSVLVQHGSIIHLSQATLGEVKKDGEPVTVSVKVGEKKLVLGILSKDTPQLSFDLVFDEDFEISHNWKNGSVHLLGYQSEMGGDAVATDEDFSDEFSSGEEDVPVPVAIKENGKPSAAAAPKAAAKPKAEVKAEDEDEDSDEDEESDDDSDDDMVEGDESDDDDLEGSEDDDSEEEEPAKPAVGSKRKPEAKTPESKKAKLATPQKTDGKKGGHTATPHPSKKGGKTPGGDKSTPNSKSQISCGSCKKTFNSDKALESHSKAKHSGK